MFTGLIEEVGTVIAMNTSKSGNQLKLAAPRVAKKIRRGDSLAVSGCCLTLHSHRGGVLIFDLLEETIARTNLKNLQRKRLVNLERAVTASERLGGHFIQGHIDCVSPVITSPAALDFAIRMGKPPDIFELRLDRLVRAVDRLENRISKLRAPLIITARHPIEGGANRLSAAQRHNLLARFLSRARYIDVELRSAPVFRSLLRMARKQNVRQIISVHCLKSTPSPNQLR